MQQSVCESSMIWCLRTKGVSRTLNTNFSPLRMAMVSKCPSQMSGPTSGVDDLVGRGGGGGGGGPPDLVPEGETLQE